MIYSFVVASSFDQFQIDGKQELWHSVRSKSTNLTKAEDDDDDEEEKANGNHIHKHTQ